jgi:triosephosphate isomerase
MRKWLVANWKENPTTEREALALFKKIAMAKRGSGVRLVVCPSFVHLDPIAKKLRALRSKENLFLGAQDVFWEDQGAFTGGIGSAMLRSLGVRYVIVGHSERRKFLHETDAMTNKKVLAALAAGLAVILCVGEPLAVRKQGTAAVQRFIKNQLIKDLAGIRVKDKRLKIKDLIIAYEPIWAIGTGKNANPADAAEMAKFIKKTLRPAPCALRPPVLYGGSVTGKSVMDYVDYKDIDGALVGGASIRAEEFRKMIESLTERKRRK